MTTEKKKTMPRRDLDENRNIKNNIQTEKTDAPSAARYKGIGHFNPMQRKILPYSYMNELPN